jgi:hypothetical protein
VSINPVIMDPASPAISQAILLPPSKARRDRALSVQCTCTGLVALCAAYASYRHGREFALRFGADAATAVIWPLMVDGLLTMSTIELWRSGRGKHSGGRWAAWLAFAFGICVSLCANVAAAPELTVPAVTVAACPPLALLLAVELLSHALKRHRAETLTETASTGNETSGTAPAGSEMQPSDRLAAVSAWPGPVRAATAAQRMQAYYLAERAKGRTPTGAELDRVAGTNNYGRRVLRRWREIGSVPRQQSPASGARPTLPR